MGVRKVAKMGKNGKYWKNNEKSDEEKIMKFSMSCIKTMHLYFNHQIMPEKNVKMPWGGPWECTNMGKAMFLF